DFIPLGQPQTGYFYPEIKTDCTNCLSMKKLSIPRLTALTGLLAAIFFFALLAVQPLAAQTPAAHHVTGKITAQSSGAPIPGASVTVKGTRNSVQADPDGSFSIMAAPNEVLVISSVGYANREIKVG